MNKYNLQEECLLSCNKHLHNLMVSLNRQTKTPSPSSCAKQMHLCEMWMGTNTFHRNCDEFTHATEVRDCFQLQFLHIVDMYWNYKCVALTNCMGFWESLQYRLHNNCVSTFHIHTLFECIHSTTAAAMQWRMWFSIVNLSGQEHNAQTKYNPFQ